MKLNALKHGAWLTPTLGLAAFLGLGLFALPLFQLITWIPLYNGATYLGTTPMYQYIYLSQALTTHDYYVFGNILVAFSVLPLLVMAIVAALFCLVKRYDPTLLAGIQLMASIVGLFNSVFLLSGQIASPWGYLLGGVYLLLTAGAAIRYISLLQSTKKAA